MRILGIDPGSNATGYGLIDFAGGVLRHLEHGVLRPSRSAGMAVRLAGIHRGVAELVERTAPDMAAVERVFLAANPRSALVLGQARGVALAALGSAGIEVAELAAREVKKSVVGTGSASKKQVQAMVQRLLALDAEPPSDAADALAIAICQAHMGRLVGLGVGRRRARRSRWSAVPRSTRFPT